MVRWQFWKRDEPPPQPEEPPAPGRFGIRPRTDLAGSELPEGDPRAAALAALRRRREVVSFDLEQAESAYGEDNPWRRRIAAIGEALEAVEAERRTAQPPSGPPGAPLPATPVEELQVDLGPPPRVSFGIGAERFVYAEELDWAERGFQIARSDLQREEGDAAALVPTDVPPGERDELVSVLSASLFAFATEARDATLEERPLPTAATLADFARPDPTFGGWTEWDGSSPRRRAHEERIAALAREADRLRAERDEELEEEARWQERLPIAQRRLRDVDEEIAALLARRPEG